MIASRTASRWMVPAVLFAAGLAARLAFSSFVGNDGWRASDDAKAYHDLAVNLLRRHQFVTVIDPPHRLDVAYVQRPPLTPLFLAGVYSLFGIREAVGRAGLAILGGLASTGVYALGRRLFTPTVAVVAGLLTAINPFLVFLATMPLTENLAVCLYVLLGLSLTALGSALTWPRLIASGALLGLAALNRPQILGLVILLPLWAWGAFPGNRRRQYAALAGVVGIAACVIAPWTLRNYAVTGEWIPVSSQAGVVLYQANNPFAGVALTRLEQGSRGWNNDDRWGDALGTGSPAELDRRALKLAVTFITTHPVEFLGYAVRRIRIFWSAYDDAIHRLSWYPVFLLACAGMIWSARQWRPLLPLYLLIGQTMMTAAIFTSMPRFRAPIEPILALFAAAALCRISFHLAPRRAAAADTRARAAIG